MVQYQTSSWLGLSCLCFKCYAQLFEHFQGPKPEENPTESSGGSISDAKPSGSTSGESTAKVSTDKYRNYAVVAGVVTVGAAAGWYLKSSGKKQEVQDWD